MIQLAILSALAALVLVGWFSARGKARLFARDGVTTWSRPEYHAAHLVLWILVPALLGWLAWSAIMPSLVDAALAAMPVAQQLPVSGFERASVLAEARALVVDPDAGSFYPLARELAAPIRQLNARYDLIGAVIVAILAFAGGAWGFSRLRADFPARTWVERAVMLLLLLASLVAIITTFGIVASLVYETGLFFGRVSPIDFLTGTHWSPGAAVGDDIGDSFGAVPLFWGTIYIGAIIAMIVAIPLGLMSAIFLTQYASARARRWIKPMLEILAGVPTVVYGYFAALTIAPFIRDLAASLGRDNPSTESALAAGLVMGVMIIPFVSSMADDSIAAVPSAMRDGIAGDGRDPVGNDQARADPRRTARHRRRRHAGGEPRHRRDHDRGHGGRRGGKPFGGPARFDDDRHLPDRPAPDRRPGIRQPQDAFRLRARADPVHGDTGAQHRRAAGRQAVQGSL